MNLEVSPVFYRNYQSVANVVINQGGTRSGKTYSILQMIIMKYLLPKSGLIIDIVRKTQAEIRDTLLPDWEEILDDMELTDEVTVREITKHKATHLIYEINGNKVRFIGLDKAQKKRGSKRHVLYVNEANGITLEDWIQLTIRLSGQAYVDFNPSEEFFLHEKIIESEKYMGINSLTYDADRDNPATENPRTGRLVRTMTYEIIKSNYLDNIDFLPDETVNFIESLIGQDEYYEQVYVHGNLAYIRGLIFRERFKRCSMLEYEEAKTYGEVFYGMDVGFEHYTVLVENVYYNEKVYERPLYMFRHQLDDHFLEWLEQSDISMNDPIYVDSAAATMIKKIRNAGYKAYKAVKDVKDGIRFCQSLKCFVVEDGTDTTELYVKQLNKYKFKQTADGNIVEEPVKIDDDAPDAKRYGQYTFLRKRIHVVGVN